MTSIILFEERSDLGVLKSTPILHDLDAKFGSHLGRHRFEMIEAASERAFVRWPEAPVPFVPAQRGCAPNARRGFQRDIFYD